MKFMFKMIVFVLTLSICLFNVFISYSDYQCHLDSSIREIPNIHIIGDIDDMADKEDERRVIINYSSDDVSFIKYAKIELQGSTSLLFDKKNYNIKFYDDDNYSSKYRVDFGWGEEYKYCLKANWIDRTHSRNIVSARITAKVQEQYGLFVDTPNYGVIDGFPVEVYYNGEFLGLYTLNIPKDAWLYNMDEENENHIAIVSEKNFSGGFLDKEISDFSIWDLEVGTANQKTIDKFNRLINFINNTSDDEFRESFEEYLDLDAVLNYYVLVESLYLVDNVGKNLMMVTYDGLVWYPVLYDLDASFGVNASGKKTYNYDGKVNLHVNKLFERVSSVYASEIADRYFELRSTALSEESINNILNNYMLSIPTSSIVKEQSKWEDIPGYDTLQMRNFIKKRLEYLDNEMLNMYK